MKTKTKNNRNLKYFVFLLPGFIYLVINNYIPMMGTFIAFKKLNFSKGIFGSDWCGFENFRFLFKSSVAWEITRNTICYNAAFIFFNTVLSILTAIMLCELGRKISARMYQSILILPHMLSWVIVSYICFAFLSEEKGLINYFLEILGKTRVAWYSDPSAWVFILLIVHAWKHTGYSAIIYMASISGIDSSIREAGKIDGLGKLGEIRYIILPMIKPTIIVMVLMNIGRIFFSDFGLFYQVPMNTGALYQTTQTIDTYVFRALMNMGDYGMSSAAGLYQSVLGFILVLAANLFVKKIDPDSALF